MQQKFKKIDPLNQVAEFHKTFKAPVFTEPTFPQKERRNLRVSLLQEEVDELKEAVEIVSIVDVADALCDIQYVLAGAVLEFGLGEKFPDLFNEVQRSNMSKACKTEEEAYATQQYYRDERQTESYIVLQENGTWLVFREGDNKVLKSVNYSEADLKTIITTPAKYPSHQQRILTEKEELDEKCVALSDFILSNPLYGQLVPEERADMYMQLQQMMHYSDTLQRRINRFKQIY